MYLVVHNTYPGNSICGPAFKNQKSAEHWADLLESLNEDPGETDYTVHFLAEDPTYTGKA